MSFEFQLVITEKCNLACTYCYMDNQSVHMTRDVFDAHYEMLPQIMDESNRSTDKYHLALFGGEPLLNWDLIEYIVPIVKKDPKCEFIMIISNGLLLTESKLEYIKEHRIGLSISFDGLWNKINRPLVNNKSSFDEYMKEPLHSYLKNSNGCKVMISPPSIPTLVDNYKWFVEDFELMFPDFSIVRDDIWSDQDVIDFKIESRKLADQVIKYINQGLPTLPGLFKLRLLDKYIGEHFGKRPFGCFAGNGGAGFLPDGKVYPCARFGSSKITPLYDSMTGKSHSKNIKFYKSDQISNPSTYSKCDDCEIRLYCNAGCTYSHIKNKCEPIDNVCKLFKILHVDSLYISDALKDNNLFNDIMKKSIDDIG